MYFSVTVINTVYVFQCDSDKYSVCISVCAVLVRAFLYGHVRDDYDDKLLRYIDVPSCCTVSSSITYTTT